MPRAAATSPLPPGTAGPDGGDAAWWHGDCWGSGEGRFEAAWCKEPWQEAEVWEAPWHSDDWSGSHSWAMPFGGRRGGPEAPIWYDQASQCTYYSWSFQGPTRECVLPSSGSEALKEWGQDNCSAADSNDYASHNGKLESLRVGQKYWGTVKQIMKVGAFVSIGNLWDIPLGLVGENCII